MTLESTQLNIHKQSVVLDGPFYLEADWGEISAQKTILNPSGSRGKLQFNSAHFEGDVSIAIRELGKLYCTDADVDLKEGVAHFTVSSDPEKLVIYHSWCEKEREDGASLEVESKKITAYFNLVEKKGKKQLQSSPVRIEVEGDIRIKVGDNMHGTCEKAVIYFVPANQTLALETINLNGNVRLLNKVGALPQYALADHLIYDNNTRQIHLVGTKAKRVLLYDKINDLQVSAPEIKIYRDQMTHKEQFRGVGDVRFQFAEKEFDQIRKRFLIEKNSLDCK